MACRSVYIYCVNSDKDQAYYQHQLIALAEGLRNLGISVFSNTNYWRSNTDESYLIQETRNVKAEECDCVVVGHSWLDKYHSFPNSIYNCRDNTIVVYVDASDGMVTYDNSSFDPFNLILRSHFNTAYELTKRVHPWAFGLTERIIEYTADAPPIEDRNKCILFNFRNNHLIRRRAKRHFKRWFESLLPMDSRTDMVDDYPLGNDEVLLWSQTGRRHNPAYYTRLKTSVACATFGGFFALSKFKRLSGVPYHMARIGLHAWDPLWRRFGFPPMPVFQWDSWRLWESLAAGTVAFNLDFDLYGMKLPVMLENRRHYIGIDFADMGKTYNILASNPGLLEKISEEGRQWAIEHYSPSATAQRFINLLS